MAEFSEHSAGAMSCVLAPVEGLWGLQGPLGRQGHPITWGRVQTEVSAVRALTWAPTAKPQHGDVHGAVAASFGKPVCSSGADLERRDFLLIQSIRAQAPGRKSQAYKFAQ